MNDTTRDKLKELGVNVEFLGYSAFDAAVGTVYSRTAENATKKLIQVLNANALHTRAAAIEAALEDEG